MTAPPQFVDHDIVATVAVGHPGERGCAVVAVHPSWVSANAWSIAVLVDGGDQVHVAVAVKVHDNDYEALAAYRGAVSR